MYITYPGLLLIKRYLTIHLNLSKNVMEGNNYTTDAINFEQKPIWKEYIYDRAYYFSKQLCKKH